VRLPDGGDRAGTVIERASDYGAPVCSHFGDNVYSESANKPCSEYGGCTLCDPAKIQYIDELDPEDNVATRLAGPLADGAARILRPEVEKHGDGIVCATIFVPTSARLAENAALHIAKQMGLKNGQVISRRVLHPAEGSVFEVKGMVDVAIDIDEIPTALRAEPLTDSEIEAWARPRNIHLVAATVGEDEHNVGIREILDIKHGGIEKYGFHCHFIGTSVPLERLLAEALEVGARVILISTIVTHGDVHKQHMRRLAELARRGGVRGRFLLIAGGAQITDDIARECAMDAGFGRGTKGRDVASFIVRTLREQEKG
jgi:D-ornithine 4,5-aminomutase subunit beta